MFQKFSLFLLLAIASLYTTAQKAKLPAAPARQNVYNFTKINPKLQYVFIEDKATSGHPQPGDDVMMRMIAICNNRFLYNSSQLYKGQPGTFSISAPLYEGDIAPALMLMTPGDSLICLADAQAVYTYTKKPLPDFIKPGDKIQYNIRLVSIKPKEQLQKEQQETLQKLLQQPDSFKVTDDQLLQQYFLANRITPLKTFSGLYYNVHTDGKGPLARPGDTVVVNYTGRLLDGTVFDSNTDAAFGHVQPLTFVLGRGMVIKGWDEGIEYLRPGSKGTFYIPAALSYGPQSRPGNPVNPKGIPANSVLIFDVELMGIKGK